VTRSVVGVKRTGAHMPEDITFGRWLEDLTFGRWVRQYKSIGPLLISAVTALVYILKILGIKPEAVGLLSRLWSPAPWFLLHVVVIFVLFGFTLSLWPKPMVRGRVVQSGKYPDASEDAFRFFSCFLALWLSWALLYIALTIEAVYETRWEPVIIVLNNVQSVACLLLFWYLTFPRTWLIFWSIIGIALLITFAAIIAYPFVPVWMSIISSSFGALAFALLIGRLNSRFLMVPLMSIVGLYCYAILEASGWLVHELYHTGGENKFLLYTGIAMILKVLVYLVCSWLLVSGRLLYYCEEMRLLSDAGKQESKPMGVVLRAEDRLRAFLHDV
jgi:hypothetical protein